MTRYLAPLRPLSLMENLSFCIVTMYLRRTSMFSLFFLRATKFKIFPQSPARFSYLVIWSQEYLFELIPLAHVGFQFGDSFISVDIISPSYTDGIKGRSMRSGIKLSSKSIMHGLLVIGWRDWGGGGATGKRGVRSARRGGGLDVDVIPGELYSLVFRQSAPQESGAISEVHFAIFWPFIIMHWGCLTLFGSFGLGGGLSEKLPPQSHKRDTGFQIGCPLCFSDNQPHWWRVGI